MKKLLGLFTALLVALVTLGAATDRWTVNRQLNGDYKLIVNISGVPTTVMQVTGSNGFVQINSSGTSFKATGALNQAITVQTGATGSLADIDLEPVTTANTGQGRLITEIDPAADTGSTPIMKFHVNRSSNVAITTRPLFQWENHTTTVGTVAQSGLWTIPTLQTNGKVSAVAPSSSSTVAATGFGGRSVNGSSSPVDTGIPAYAGNSGQANLFVCSRQTGNASNTYAALYVVRSFFDNVATWTAGVGVTFIGGGALGANTGGDTCTFSLSGTEIFVTCGSGNWSCQIFGNG